MFYRNWTKRGLDVVLSVIMLLLLSPIFLILLISLTIYHRGNPFFFQKRPGKDHVSFFILKFKTMDDQTNGYGHLLSDADRLSNFGKFIRNTSLDEIPQLINVIKGDMSLVGPRPLLEEYLELYNQDQLRRHDVRPGVTGWAQINGRNAISWEKKFEYDLWYVNNLNFLIDFKILLVTLYNVVRGKGVSQKGHVSMGRFKGESIA